jgi:hypothetical protein
MPYRPHKIAQRQKRVITPINLYEILTGHCFFHAEDLGDDLPAVWARLRTPMLAWYAEVVPGCRPHAWWLLEAPAPRLVLEGAHRCPAREALMQTRDLWFGRPPVYVCDQCWTEVYESQVRYLRRLGLLLPEEVDVPYDLDECDAWFLEAYDGEEHPDVFETGMAFETCADFLRDHGLHR